MNDDEASPTYASGRLRYDEVGPRAQACVQTAFEARDRIRHFTARASADGRDPSTLAIVLISMDDPYGWPLGDHLMPHHDWDQYRKQGMKPYARGLATREGLAEYFDRLSPGTARELRAATLPVLVMDHAQAVVLEADQFDVRHCPP